MNDNLESSKVFSKTKLEELQKETSTSFTTKYFDENFLDNICVYACGSLARCELVENSDLDLFFINNEDLVITNINKYIFILRDNLVSEEFMTASRESKKYTKDSIPSEVLEKLINARKNQERGVLSLKLEDLFVFMTVSL